MKKVLKILSIQTVLTLFPAAVALAVVEAPALNVMDALNRITNWLFSILLVIAAIFIIIAGYYFVVAQGDPEKTKTARLFVLYALIGVLIGFLAKGLVILVGTILGYSISGGWGF